MENQISFDELTKFVEHLTKREFCIKDLRSLFYAVSPAGPVGAIGDNAFWNWELCLTMIYDNWTGDRAILGTYKNRNFLFREMETKRFFKKELLQHAFDELTKF